MKLQDQFDWVVLGEHPAALLTGCLVAQQGYSVLMTPASPPLVSFVSHSGQLIDPEVNYLAGLGLGQQSDGLLSLALNQLGVLSSSSQQFYRGPEWLPQIITPDARVTVHADVHLF